MSALPNHPKSSTITGHCCLITNHDIANGNQRVVTIDQWQFFSLPGWHMVILKNCLQAASMQVARGFAAFSTRSWLNYQPLLNSFITYSAALTFSQPNIAKAPGSRVSLCHPSHTAIVNPQLTGMTRGYTDRPDIDGFQPLAS